MPTRSPTSPCAPLYGTRFAFGRRWTQRLRHRAFVEGDLAAILNLITDDVEFVPPISSRPSAVAGSGQVCRGPRGVEQYLRTVAEAYEFQVFEPDEFIVDRDTVVVLGHERCCVRATDRVVEVQWAQVFTFRNGRVCRHREFTDTAAWEAGFHTR